MVYASPPLEDRYVLSDWESVSPTVDITDSTMYETANVLALTDRTILSPFVWREVKPNQSIGGWNFIAPSSVEDNSDAAVHSFPGDQQPQGSIVGYRAVGALEKVPNRYNYSNSDVVGDKSWSGTSRAVNKYPTLNREGTRDGGTVQTKSWLMESLESLNTLNLAPKRPPRVPRGPPGRVSIQRGPTRPLSIQEKQALRARALRQEQGDRLETELKKRKGREGDAARSSDLSPGQRESMIRRLGRVDDLDGDLWGEQ